MVHGIEGFGKIDCQGGCSVGRFRLVETGRDEGRERQEGCGSGVHGAETVLSAVRRHG